MLNGLKLIALLCLLQMCLSVAAPAWQSYGNFTSDNISLIQGKLDLGFAALASGALTESAFVKNISDELNAAWNPAWNVMLLSNYNEQTTPDGADGTLDFSQVLYGYAFNAHWLWFNNYYSRSTATTYFSDQSIIIWKDYKCSTWVTIDLLSEGMDPTKYNPIYNAANAIALDDNNKWKLGDPWEFAFSLAKSAETLYPGEAYSVIASSFFNDVNARLCLVTDTSGVPQFFKNYVLDIDYRMLGFLVMRIA